MERLTIQQILDKINAEETFHAVSSDYSFKIFRINDNVASSISLDSPSA